MNGFYYTYVCFRYAPTNQYFDGIYFSGKFPDRTTLILAICRYLLVVYQKNEIDAKSVNITGVTPMSKEQALMFSPWEPIEGLNINTLINVGVTYEYSHKK